MGHEHEERRRGGHGPEGARAAEAAPGRRTLTDGLDEAAAAHPAATRAIASPGARVAAQPEFARARARGGGPAASTGAGPAANLADFARDFNREFAAQLHAFGTDERAAAERGPQADTRTVQPTDSSGDEVSADRLAQLFTPSQIDGLAAFIATRRIPERLFNGDDVGGAHRATAQQRILLAGHILAQGEYVPGSFPQRLHARMCGHWVTLVNHYAGVAQGGGAGIIENFDHTGGLSLSVTDGATADGDPALRGTARAATRLRHAETPEAGARARVQFEGVPFEDYATIQPGDWLWVYNDNGSTGGNHSVIFSRWASAELRVSPAGAPVEGDQPGVRYRRAITMSQIGPSVGGREEIRLLGERRVAVGRAHLSPITRIMHIDPSARPIQRMEDVVALLGSHPRTADRNRRFLERIQRGGTFDAPRFVAYLRGRNAALLEQLAGRMTPVQQQAFRQTNDAEHGGEHGTLGTLVRLNERLTNFVANAQALEAGHARRQAAVDTRHAEMDARLAPRRQELEDRRAECETNLTAYETQRQEAESRIDVLDDVPPKLRIARQARRARRPLLRAQRRHAETEAERTALEEELAALDAAVAAAEESEREGRPELRETRRQARRLGGLIQRETVREQGFERQLAELTAQSGYLLVADGVQGGTFQGRGEARATGLLENLAPAPTWSAFITRE